MIMVHTLEIYKAKLLRVASIANDKEDFDAVNYRQLGVININIESNTRRIVRTTRSIAMGIAIASIPRTSGGG